MYVKLPPYKLITTQTEWQACLDRLMAEERLAIDLEANSLYAYREKVCLIQVSAPEQDYIIDPLIGLDLEKFGDIIYDSRVEKIFHAAEYDLILMKRQFGWTLNNLFDTMWAARILGYTRCGLANLLESHYGIELNKKHQKANWSRRPLPITLLKYAQMDTHYLLSLRDDLATELHAAGRTQESQEIFTEQCCVQINSNEFDPDGFWSISGVRELRPKQQAIVRGLYIYRDDKASKQDRPPFKVFDDRTILELALAAPQRLEDLPEIHGMSKGQIRRYGRQILRVIREAQQAPSPQKPKTNSKRPPDSVAARYERLHGWRRSRAQDRGVESDVILSRDTMWDLAWTNPASHDELENVNSLGPWRREAYGREILEVLQKH